VVEHLRQVEESGIEEVICYFSFGAYPHRQVLHQMERFSSEILPVFA
jgi:hypothetical protein